MASSAGEMIPRAISVTGPTGLLFFGRTASMFLELGDPDPPARFVFRAS
jgi:hypothetical protein